MRKMVLVCCCLLMTGMLEAAGSLSLSVVDGVSTTECLSTTDCVVVEKCVRAPDNITMTIFNDGTGDSSISLSYSTTTGQGSLSGPAGLTVADGATVTFDVGIVPDSASVTGDAFEVEVRASNSVTSASLILDIRYGRVTGWTTSDSSALGTRFHAAAWHDGKIYEIGGDLDGGVDSFLATGSTKIFDLSGGSWTTGPAMPDPAYGISAAVLDDEIYVIGGTNCEDDPHDGCATGDVFDTVRVFDTVSGAWSTEVADPAPFSLAFSAVVVSGGSIYVFGGLDSTGHSSAGVWIYNPVATAGSRWSTGTSMAAARAHAAGAIMDGKIYIAGGWDRGSTLLDALDIYNPTTDGWMTGSLMPAAFSSMAGVALDDRFLFLPTDETLNSNYPVNYTVGTKGYSYDRVLDRWFENAGPLKPVYGTQAVSDGSRVWLISGREKVDEITFGMSTRVDESQGCVVDEIFADGFEDGTTNAWSG